MREPLRKGAPRNATAPIEQKTRLGNPESAASRTNVAGPGRTRSVTSILGALAGVLGLFFVVTWVLRRSLPQSSQRLPSEVVEVLGHAPLGQRQQAQLIRLGHKLLLVSVTPTGAETLSEVTDPAEVSRLTSLCRGRGPAGAPLRFRNVLEQLKERSAPGSPGRPAASSVTTRTSAQEGARG